MKKGFLILVAAATATIMVACGGNEQEKQAAKDFCDCHGPVVKLMKESGEAESARELLSGNQALIEAISKQKICHDAWMKTYNERVDVEVLKEEVKAINNDVYKMADEEGFFGK
ncbi:MAG: hypothetical protein ACFHU9_11250 [Fluviicola sp.]